MLASAARPWGLAAPLGCSSRPSTSAPRPASVALETAVAPLTSASRGRLVVARTYPDPCIPETEKERSTLDFPQEWMTPVPSRRPDIFPEFERLKHPDPKPMPGDPELPDEEELEEEERKRREEPEPGEDSPDKEKDKDKDKKKKEKEKEEEEGDDRPQEVPVR